MSCSKMPASFMQMLASALLKDEAGNILGINVIIGENATKCKGVSLIDCETNLSDPESLVVANAFGIDTCGNVALKIYLGDKGA